MTQEQPLPAILLVAASEHTRKSIERLLTDDYRIEHVAQTDQAWDRLQGTDRFNAVACELELAIDDTALVERIRKAQNRTIASLPVLLLVGESNDEQQRDLAFVAGATDFVNMPFSSTELKARMRLHTRLISLHRNDPEYELGEENTTIDLLNVMMHEQHFKERLSQELAFSLRHKTYVSVCLLEIDKVDELHEQFGKKVVGGIIKTVANIIASKIRSEDTYAYLGEATYAVLFPVTNGIGANVATRRLLEKVEQSRIRLGGEEIPVTLSGGLYSALSVERQSADEIMDIVSGRLDNARQKGGNQVVSSKTEQEQNDISIEQALNMISHERTNGLEKQVPHLLDTLMPLLEFAREHNEVELEGVFGSLDLSS